MTGCLTLLEAETGAMLPSGVGAMLPFGVCAMLPSGAGVGKRMTGFPCTFCGTLVRERDRDTHGCMYGKLLHRAK